VNKTTWIVKAFANGFFQLASIHCDALLMHINGDQLSYNIFDPKRKMKAKPSKKNK